MKDTAECHQRAHEQMEDAIEWHLISCWRRSKTVEGQDRTLEELPNTEQRHQTSRLLPKLVMIDELHTKRTTFFRSGLTTAVFPRWGKQPGGIDDLCYDKQHDNQAINRHEVEIGSKTQNFIFEKNLKNLRAIF